MHARAEFSRTLVIGNSGSGKSWLASRLAAATGSSATDLDEIVWVPGGYGVKRDEHLAVELVRRVAQQPSWVIEGVYGWLAQEAVGCASALAWLDIPESECIKSLRQRGLRRGGDAGSFEELLAWTSEYRERNTSSSYSGHQRLFQVFEGLRLHLQSRDDVYRLVAELAVQK